MNKPLKLNDRITVNTQAGPVPGLFIGMGENGTARVAIDCEHAPQAVKDAHKSRWPNIWVSLRDVEAK